jgi:hypothetical protein
MVDAIQNRFLMSEFEEGEFSVYVNNNMGTITVVRNEDRRALTLMDITGSFLKGGAFPGDPITVHLPTS